MKNPRLYYLLRRIGLSPQKIAEDPSVLSSRAHVTECLLNKPGRGKNTRKRIARLLAPEFVTGSLSADELQTRIEIMRLLSWDKCGNIVPHGEPQLEQNQNEREAQR